MNYNWKRRHRIERIQTYIANVGEWSADIGQGLAAVLLVSLGFGLGVCALMFTLSNPIIALIILMVLSWSARGAQ